MHDGLDMLSSTILHGKCFPTHQCEAWWMSKAMNFALFFEIHKNQRTEMNFLTFMGFKGLNFNQTIIIFIWILLLWCLKKEFCNEFNPASPLYCYLLVFRPGLFPPHRRYVPKAQQTRLMNGSQDSSLRGKTHLEDTVLPEKNNIKNHVIHHMGFITEKHYNVYNSSTDW